MQQFVSVSDAALSLNVSIDTLRRWEKKGLIKARRDDRNYRVFDINELRRAHGKYIGAECHINRYEILKSPQKTSFTSAELFAGAGGLALGLEK